jgi:hypothetical protein
MNTNETPQPAETKWELTKAERRTLRAFRLQHRVRYLTWAVLVFLLLYCLSIGSTSIYFAYQLFRGEKIVEANEEIPSTKESIEKYMDQLRPWIERADFFNLGWTSLLHAVLLFYIASRAFLRLRRWKSQTPRAKLVMKLAGRLEELGELNLST